jgi:hypothetical protein
MQASKPEQGFDVGCYHQRRPRRVERYDDIDRPDPRHARCAVGDAILEKADGRASRRGGRHHDMREAVGDHDCVDKSEVDDIVPEFGVDDSPERFPDQFNEVIVIHAGARTVSS